MNRALYIGAGIAVVAIALWATSKDAAPILTSDGETMPASPSNSINDTELAPDSEDAQPMSDREVLITDDVRHSIPLDEIRQGCPGRDCIPSVDEPTFVTIEEADNILPDDTVGIALEYKGEKRFYPFNMLVTREIVNDVVAGDPLAITYCPLCNTGVVFSRDVGAETFEFGVSGMLWQSNLLMYNRAAREEDISLWSQVLGEAVVGPHTGTVLTSVRSDVVDYTAWRSKHPDTLVLSTGSIGDPYNGDYYRVARSFRPNFDEEASPLPPTTQIYGIRVDDVEKAYSAQAIPMGLTMDVVGGSSISIERASDGTIHFVDEETGNTIPHVPGFWFSWKAAHPQTELFENK